MSEPDIDPHHGIPLVNTAIDDPLDGVSDPPSSSLSPQEMNFPGNDFSPMPRHPPSGPSGTARYKSWKKKYNKMRHGFKDVMFASNHLYEEEQKLERVARRLKEQNDQLLELLLDINASARLDPALRYDLSSPPPSASAVPALEPDDGSSPAKPPQYTIAQARDMLAASEVDLAAGAITARDHTALVASLRAAGLAPPARTLALLDDVPHTAFSTLEPAMWPEELREGHGGMAGYLTAQHEDEYLAAGDSVGSAGDVPPVSAPPEPTMPTGRRGGGPSANNIALELGNPSSAFNWLKANGKLDEGRGERAERGEPHANGAGGAEGKATPGPSNGDAGPVRRDGAVKREGGRTKRFSAANMTELLDDMGYVIGEAPVERGGAGMGRGKRKREDEPYRPKGGSGRARRKTSEARRDAVLRKAGM